MSEDEVVYKNPRRLGDISVRRIGDEVIADIEFVFKPEDREKITGEFMTSHAWSNTFRQTIDMVYDIIENCNN